MAQATAAVGARLTHLGVERLGSEQVVAVLVQRLVEVDENGQEVTPEAEHLRDDDDDQHHQPATTTTGGGEAAYTSLAQRCGQLAQRAMGVLSPMGAGWTGGGAAADRGGVRGGGGGGG